MIGEEYRAPEQRPFNLWETLIGVIVRPVDAMRQLAAARPWPIGLAVYITIALISGFATLTAAPPQVAPTPGMTPELEAMMELTRSPWLVMGSAVVASPIFLTIWCGIIMLVSRLFKGSGPFSAVFSTISFASVPSVLFVPLTILLNIFARSGALAAFSLLQIVFGLVIIVWTAILQIIGIRESQSLSTGQAVAVYLIPIAVLLLLGCIVGLILTFALVAAFRS